MSLHKSELANLEHAGGAALRKYRRLLAEAQGAQHGSPAQVAVVSFEHQWIHDPRSLIEQAERAEQVAKLKPEKGESHGRSN